MNFLIDDPLHPLGVPEPKTEIPWNRAEIVPLLLVAENIIESES